jgi:hypothetical protein
MLIGVPTVIPDWDVGVTVPLAVGLWLTVSVTGAEKLALIVALELKVTVVTASLALANVAVPLALVTVQLRNL